MAYVDTDEKRQRRPVHVPMGRFDKAADMAPAGMLLASSDSSNLPGAKL